MSVCCVTCNILNNLQPILLHRQTTTARPPAVINIKARLCCYYMVRGRVPNTGMFINSSSSSSSTLLAINFLADVKFCACVCAFLCATKREGFIFMTVVLNMVGSKVVRNPIRIQFKLFLVGIVSRSIESQVFIGSVWHLNLLTSLSSLNLNI